MSELRTFTVSEKDKGERIDVAVAAQIQDLSRSTARALLEDGRIKVNGSEVKPSHRLSFGDVVSVEVVRRPSLSAEPERIPLTVVYKNSDLVVIDKPPGLVVHPAAGHARGTLANALAAMFPEVQGVGSDIRPGIVHRLDKDTSGLMVIALSARAQTSIQAQIASRTAQRRYLALAQGHVYPAEARIDAPIGRDPGDRKKMAAFGIAARPASTSYTVLEYLPGFSLLEARLHTGRTHQIRVHCAAILHPLAGDSSYHGPALPDLQRQFLHAYRLSLQSPSTGEWLHFSSDLPPDLEVVLQNLRGTEQ